MSRFDNNQTGTLMQIFRNESDEVIVVHGDHWTFSNGVSQSVHRDMDFMEFMNGDTGYWVDVTKEYPKTFRQKHLLDGYWEVTFEYPYQKRHAVNDGVTGLIEWTEAAVIREMDIEEGSPYCWFQVFSEYDDDDQLLEFSDDLVSLSEITEAADRAGRGKNEPLSDFILDKLDEVEDLAEEVADLKSRIKAGIQEESIALVNLKKQLRHDMRGVFEEFVDKFSMSAYANVVAKKVDELDTAVRMSVAAGIFGVMLAAVVYASMMYQIFWSK